MENDSVEERGGRRYCQDRIRRAVSRRLVSSLIEVCYSILHSLF